MLDEYFTVPPPVGVAAPLPPAPPDPPRRRRAALFLVAGVLAVAAGAVVMTTGGPAPLVLPETLAGLAPTGPDEDFAPPEWIAQMEEHHGGAPVLARRFGARASPATMPLLHLIVVAGAGDGRGDIAFAGPVEQRFGEVSCTQSFQYDPAVPPARSRGTALCWRASGDLTVSVLGLLTPEGYAPTVAAAVQDVWDRNS